MVKKIIRNCAIITCHFAQFLKTGAAVLAVTNVFSTTVLTAGENTWSANRANTVIESPVYLDHSVIDVELPGDLNFVINPFSLDVDGDGTADSQIISEEYLITNNSNVPVLVETKMKLTGGDKVDVLPDAVYDEKTKDLKPSADGKKAIWMVQLLPTAPANLFGEGDILTVAPLKPMDNNTSIKGKVIGSTDETAATVLFLLDANTGGTVNPGCVSGFKFAGAVDPAQVFDNTDAVKITTVFTLNILNADEASQNYNPETGYDKTIVKRK